MPKYKAIVTQAINYDFNITANSENEANEMLNNLILDGNFEYLIVNQDSLETWLDTPQYSEVLGEVK